MGEVSWVPDSFRKWLVVWGRDDPAATDLHDRTRGRRLNMTSAIDIDLRNRLALSIAEAAKVVGLSEATFRTALPDIERVYVGRRVLIPVSALNTWLKREGKLNDQGDDAIVNGMLKATR
jgi:excisionase family DNA binding protein